MMFTELPDYAKVAIALVFLALVAGLCFFGNQLIRILERYLRDDQ